MAGFPAVGHPDLCEFVENDPLRNAWMIALHHSQIEVRSEAAFLIMRCVNLLVYQLLYREELPIRPSDPLRQVGDPRKVDMSALLRDRREREAARAGRD